jgi:hypothetical protein
MVGLGIPAYHSKLAAALPTAAALSIWPQIDTRCSGAGRFEEWNDGGRKIHSFDRNRAPGNRRVVASRFGAEHVLCIEMADHLEPEGERLKARLADLEREHEALHGRPEDREDHEVHRTNLVEYEADVHSYGERLPAERRARGLPDLKLPKS